MSYSYFGRLSRGFISSVTRQVCGMSSSAKQKVLVTRRVPEKAMKMLRAAPNLDLDVWDTDDPIPRDVLLKRMAGVDGLYCLLTEKIDNEVLSSAGSQLKIISTMSVGYDHIDIKETNRRNIPVGFTPNVLTDATATLTVALLLAVQRRLLESAEEAKNGGWGTWKPMWMCGPTLAGSTVGIVGLGRIGQAVARRLRPFGVSKFLYFQKNPRADVASEFDAKFVDLNTLLRESDFVSANTALTDETKGMFNKEAFSRMKRSAVFVNTSRGGVVNQEDLVHALQNGEIWIERFSDDCRKPKVITPPIKEAAGIQFIQSEEKGAGLDVTVPEPLPTSHALFSLKNCVVLPHIGSAEEATRTDMATLAVSNLLAGLAGEKLPAQAQ